VKRIAIAGGIGAGKSTLTQRLRAFGWPVVDADEIAREVTAPDQPAWQVLRDAFGDAVLAPDGTVDRAFLADVVFHDHSALERLNAITHPPIGVEIARQLGLAAGDAVFLALPLFRPEHRELFALDAVWAVLVEPETAVRRLCAGRGFSEEDARARLANQMSNDERRAIVDAVIENEGSVEALDARLGELLRAEGLA